MQDTAFAFGAMRRFSYLGVMVVYCEQYCKALQSIPLFKKYLYRENPEEVLPVEYFVQKNRFENDLHQRIKIKKIHPLFYNLLSAHTLSRFQKQLIGTISFENLCQLCISFGRSDVEFYKKLSKEEILSTLSVLIKDALMTRKFKSMPYALLGDIIRIQKWWVAHIVFGLNGLIEKLVQSSDIFKDKVVFGLPIDSYMLKKLLEGFHGQLEGILVDHKNQYTNVDLTQDVLKNAFEKEERILKTIEKIIAVI